MRNARKLVSAGKIFLAVQSEMLALIGLLQS